MDKMTNLMKKQQRGQFNFDVFKLAYDADPKLQELVKNFDQEQIELKQSETDDLPTQKDTANPDAVSDMAKRATDLSKSI